jgi:hypothetical protein
MGFGSLISEIETPPAGAKWSFILKDSRWHAPCLFFVEAEIVRRD